MQPYKLRTTAQVTLSGLVLLVVAVTTSHAGYESIPPQDTQGQYGSHRVYVHKNSHHNNVLFSAGALYFSDIPVFYHYVVRDAEDAGYIACYRNQEDDLTSIATGEYGIKLYYTLPNQPFHVTGLIRVKAFLKKQDGITVFHPQDDSDRDIDKYNGWSGSLCNRVIPACDGGQCWAGGDVVGFYPLLEKEYTGNWPKEKLIR